MWLNGREPVAGTSEKSRQRFHFSASHKDDRCSGSIRVTTNDKNFLGGSWLGVSVNKILAVVKRESENSMSADQLFQQELQCTHKSFVPVSGERTHHATMDPNEEGASPVEDDQHLPDVRRKALQDFPTFPVIGWKDAPGKVVAVVVESGAWL